MKANLQLKEIINRSSKIVFFGGAGVSVPSGIPDFRSSTGLFQEKGEFSPEEILSRTFFEHYPQKFFRFYKDKMIFPDAKPNRAHYALAKLEEQGKVLGIITQNIDGLHQEAGSKKVYELHGSIRKNYCMKCLRSYDLQTMLEAEELPHCQCGGIIRPDVVLYEENLRSEVLEASINLITNADTLIVAGTSLLVNPAASLVRYFKGDYFIIINMSSTPYDNYVDLVIRGDVAEALGDAVGV